MALAPITEVKHFAFDLDRREAAIYHSGDVAPVSSALAKLGLGEALVGSDEAMLPTSTQDEHTQRRILWWVLGINGAFFVLEMSYGWLAGSMGLVADSLDMLADALVYALALLAVGSTMASKMRVARISGWLQVSLALFGLIEVVRRALGTSEVPDFWTMIVIASLALLGNAVCLRLLRGTASEEAHLRASVIFTSNDIVVNLGVIASGVLVYVLGVGWPDLVIGAVVFAVVLRGAVRILRL